VRIRCGSKRHRSASVCLSVFKRSDSVNGRHARIVPVSSLWRNMLNYIMWKSRLMMWSAAGFGRHSRHRRSVIFHIRGSRTRKQISKVTPKHQTYSFTFIHFIQHNAIHVYIIRSWWRYILFLQHLLK
jgi:hypothetical protein